VENAKLIGAVQEGQHVLEAWGSYTWEGSLRRLGFDGCGMNGSQAISPGWGSEIPYNRTDRLLFAAATKITIGNGKKTSFWYGAWSQGQRLKDIAPNLFKISKRKNRSLYVATQNQNWIKDLNLQHRGFNAQHFIEYVAIWRVAILQHR